MDLPEAVKKFESILKSQSDKTLNLYVQQENIYNCHLKPKEVISNLKQQLINLQKADVTNRVGPHNRTIDYKNKNKEFISVNMLGDSSEFSLNQPTTSKFESQFDTELINVVEGAELQLEQGMTQEFTTAFNKTEQNVSTDSDISKIDPNNDTLNINFKYIDETNLTCDASTRSIKESEVNCTDTDEIDEGINNIDVSMVTNCNKIIEDKDLDNNDVEIQLSPVLHCSKSRTNIKSLVYNLESFEKFESIAVPIVDENTDKRTVNKMINSQMVDKVLFLNLHTQPTLIERDKQCSPVINFANENIVVSKDVCGKASPDKRSDSLEDEMLFSSDEDDDYVHDSTPELPIGQDTSSDETEDLDKSMYVGFQTASNRSIQVCSDSFKKAKNLLNDLDTIDIISNNNNCMETKNSDIKKEEKSAIKRKSESSEKANDIRKKISEEQNNDEYEKSCTIIEEQNLSKIIDDDLIKEFDNVLMSQNDNKDTQQDNITKDIANNRSKKDLNTLDSSDEGTKVFKYPMRSSNSDIANTKKSVFCGFKTASNKEVKVSNSALAKSKAIFQDLDISGEDVCDSTIENISIKTIVGFQASNKKVEISAKGLEKGNIFENIDLSACKPESDETQIFKGFKTASDKEITISQEALKKYQNILKDIDGFDNLDDKEVNNKRTVSNYTYSSDLYLNKNESLSNVNTKSVFEGFRTASNKEVKVSEISLAKSKHIFNDLNVSDTNNLSHLPAEKKLNKLSTKKDLKTDFVAENTFCIDFAGFKTASNKNVEISKEALDKTKKLFQDLDCGTSEFTTPFNKPDKFQGFQTSSNKKVTVSEKALQETKSIFQDIDLSVKIDPKHESKREFKGFQTASNKNVLVSKEAMEKSKKLFNDFNTLESNPDLVFTRHEKSTKSFMSEDDKAKNINTIDNDLYIKPSGDKLYETEYPKKNKASGNVNFKRGNTRTARILCEALKSHAAQDDKSKDKPNSEINKNILPNNINDIESIIDTQVINHFDETLCSEDFIRCKRSGSPILSCSSAKRRKKFETPYRNSAKDIPKVQSIKSKALPTFDTKYKKSKQYNLKDILKLEQNATETFKNTNFNVCNLDNLLQFQFDGPRNDVDQNKLSVTDIIKMFEDSIDAKIIPKGWTQIHIKQIIWKLLSYEMKFPTVMKGICTANNVIEQLKYRYNKELYSSIRPALRKVMEKDEIPSRTMVLCVMAVYVDNVKVNSVVTTPNNMELLLTDGWYEIMATIDQMLMDLVVRDKIKVGTKLAVCGAELNNCEQGVAPWENASAIRLKIFGNSTRRARWDARLGFHGNGAILSHLSTVKPDGGKVSKMRVFVTRIYPMLYVEKFEDGSTVTRSERLEHLHQIKYENERQALMEKIYEEVEKELADQTSQDSDSVSGDKLETGSQIARAMKKCNDPIELKTHLTSSQLRHLQDHTSKRREEYLEKVQARLAVKLAGEAVNRRVTTMLKMRVVGVMEKEKVECRNAILTIWRPNESIMEVVREGRWIEIVNAVPTAVRYSELQLSAGRQSIFREIKQKQTESITNFTKTLKRQCYNIKDLIHNYNNDLHEIDTLGMVFLIEPAIKEFDSTKQSFQNVYLTNADKNFICVNFWGGIKKFGFESLFNIGHIVVCVNLQKRAGNTRKNIPQFRVTELTYFTKTPKDSAAKGMIDTIENKFLGVDRFKFAEDCELLKNNLNAIKMYTDNISPYRFNNSDYNRSKNKIFIDSPLTKTSKIDDNLNLTGLDFESTFRQTNTQDLSPNTLARKRKVQEKIHKLKRYGEPPPISPISIINQSKNAASAFKSPLLTSYAPNVATPKDKSPIHSPITTNIDKPSSPVIAISKNYVKKKINPVKLNFSNNAAIRDIVIDQFGEDFESSPPLSLD